MAKTNAILLCMFIMASSTYVSYSLLFGEIPLAEGTLLGILTCNFNGQPDDPAVGSLVIFVCGPNNATIAETVTGPDGTFGIILDGLKMLLFDPRDDCYLQANVPAGTCNLTGPDAILRAPVNVLSFVVLNKNGLLSLISGEFRRITQSR